MSDKARKENARTIKALREENRILRAEIKRLNRTLLAHAPASAAQKGEKDLSRKVFESEQRNALALASTSYFKYLKARLTRASFYSLLMRVFGGFRKFRLISTVIRVTSSALTVIGTGAFFIFISGTVIFFIPLILFACGAAYLASMLFRKKAFKELMSKLEGKDIFVFFPNAGRPFEEGSCFAGTLDIVSKKTNLKPFIIVISPYFFTSRGFGGHGYYPVVRFEREDVCIVRRHSFFALRKKLMRHYPNKSIYIY